MAQRPRWNVPEADGGSRIGNLFAGLGKFAIDSLSGKREAMLRQNERFNAGVDRAAIDLAKSYMGKQGELDYIDQLGPKMQAYDLVKAGPYERTKKTTVSYEGTKPNTENKTGTTSQPTTEDTAPVAETSPKKQTKSVRSAKGRKPYVTKKEVMDAVSGGHSQEAEVLGLNKAYDSMVAKREDNAGKMDTTPKLKKPKKTTSSRVIWGQPQPNMPKGGKARGGKKSNGNSGTTNGNKKGGM